MENKKYFTLVSLEKDIESGYIWTNDPQIKFRTIVRIKNLENGSKLYCEALYLDPNYVRNYNESQYTKSIPENSKVIIANNWYRNKLLIKENEYCQLDIKKSNFINSILWETIASLQHPNHAIRFALKISLISLIIGLLGFTTGIFSYKMSKEQDQFQKLIQNQENIAIKIIEQSNNLKISLDQVTDSLLIQANKLSKQIDSLSTIILKK